MKSFKIVAALALVALMFACAPALPQKDIDAATAAFTDAQTSKAEVYAVDSFKAAQDAQTALQAELDAQNAKTSGKSYKALPALAKTLLEASKKAAADAVTGLESAKSEVATLLTDVDASLNFATADLELAKKAGKKAKVNVATTAATLAAARTEYDAAKAANDAGDFATAKTSLTTLKDSVAAVDAALDAAGYKSH
jgi:hypothetical protein